MKIIAVFVMMLFTVHAFGDDLISADQNYAIIGALYQTKELKDKLNLLLDFTRNVLEANHLKVNPAIVQTVLNDFNSDGDRLLALKILRPYMINLNDRNNITNWFNAKSAKENAREILK